MNVQFPGPINDYVNASNAHDVKSIVACFSDSAAVQDEGQTLQVKEAIEGWAIKTIGKYKFHFEPLDLKDDGNQVVMAIRVSGTFDGSPVDLDYYFTIEQGKIASLAVR